MIRIVLGQNGGLMSGALANLLSLQDGMNVIAEAFTREDVVAEVSRTRPRMVVLDHDLPGSIDVADVCYEVCQESPSSSVLIVIKPLLCSSIRRTLTRLSPRIGMIVADSTPAELVSAVRALADGRPVISPELAIAALAANANPLTRREQEVLREAGHGAQSREIAAKLFLSPGTVDNHVSRAIAKTGARTRLQAVRIAEQQGWI
ncbi:two-component system response regulator DesR [Allocatelliglobosispora scoriae]|uniref:Two-component system response regulator DesR n=1 Tax=Allocatelliglobosispora scoriae TaxID=643052 RepID=A0A841BRU0_9ACTN|nr:response regulator transcription factor [Allocatelliglobosispora scoriae]MBB5870106.1 two-component system response regulator DesR [Allocatelliglobosispora scoriae]